jgi:hypothetical protein
MMRESDFERTFAVWNASNKCKHFINNKLLDLRAMYAEIDRPEITGARNLNELAVLRNWPVWCDVSCRFTIKKLDDLHALWRSKAGPSRIPARSEMTARLLKPYLAMLAFHERVSGPGGTRRYRVRLMGEEICDVAGAASRKFYDEFLPENSVPIWNAMTDAVLAHGKPVRMVIRADELNKPYLVGELFAGPLLAGDGTPRIVLTAGHFEGNRHFEDFLAERCKPRLAEPAQ